MFGLPVVALQLFGRSLGGPESDRWVTLFQALLGGWVVYVGAAGLVAEGALLLLARRLPPDIFVDCLVGLGATGLYVLGLPRLFVLLAARPVSGWFPGTFHWAVILLGVWSGLRWLTKRPGRKNRPGLVMSHSWIRRRR